MCRLGSQPSVASDFQPEGPGWESQLGSHPFVNDSEGKNNGL